jgi:hypothetical protein
VGQVEAAGYDGQVFFVPGMSNEQNTLSELLTPTSHTSSNGHSTAAVKQHAPLLYYQGKYHHLSSRYHHAHPELAPAQDSHE